MGGERVRELQDLIQYLDGDLILKILGGEIDELIKEVSLVEEVQWLSKDI